ncbi:T9SS type A sorting domain-containing protein [Brumimicrobium mesophilum]|uniref:T9SS type A sorting domain-containing protein n=1 Tax=Brumimicrobium mesophilum TaxID=392717 RepID=UPI000D14447A|nr:T9SS type A sorting domain-containing protein [Brumimicrobium mesophilum]
MKKIYFLGLILGTASLSFAQSTHSVLNKKVATNHKVITNPTAFTTKAPGVAVWQDNFDDPTTWTMDNAGQTAPNTGWTIDPTYDGWYSGGAPVAAPGGGNFAELGNGVSSSAATAQMVTYTMTTASPIDVVAAGGSQDIVLEFLQYGALFNDVQEFQISTDGTTFTTVGDNSNFDPLTSTGGSAYDNPTQVRVNLSQYLSATPTQVWIRFSWTSRFPTETANGAWITYGWMIDNVALVTLPDNDISTSESYFGSNGVAYYQIPQAQIAPIDFTVNVTNEGTSDQTGVALLATEAGSGYNGTSGGDPVLVGSTDSLIVSTSFTPSGLGNYEVEFEIEADLVDDVPANNMIPSYKFRVVEDLYARDSSSQAENGVLYNQLRQDGLVGAANIIKKYAVAYDVYADADVTAIDFQFGNQIEDGAQVVAAIYESDLETQVGETEFYTVSAGDEMTYHTLAFPTPVTLDANTTYYATVEMFSTVMSIAAAGSAPAGTSIFQLVDDSWSNLAPTNRTFVIRMNFDPSVGLEDNELSNINVSQNYPNPFANETTVEFSLKETAEVSYSVVDLTGKVVADVNEGNTFAGEHSITIDGSSFANGVYYLNITAGESTVTRKIVVNK